MSSNLCNSNMVVCREEQIWSNVILIVKAPGPGGSSLQRASQGAEEAARRYTEQGLSSTLGFTYMDQSVPEDFKLVLDSLGKPI